MRARDRMTGIFRVPLCQYARNRTHGRPKYLENIAVSLIFAVVKS